MALERLKQLLGEDNVNVLPRTKLHHGTIEQVITAKARNSNGQYPLYLPPLAYIEAFTY